MGDLLERDDIGGQGGRVEQGDRAFPPEPAASFAGVYEKSPVPGLDQRPVGMAENDDVISSGCRLG